METGTNHNPQHLPACASFSAGSNGSEPNVPMSDALYDIIKRRGKEGEQEWMESGLFLKIHVCTCVDTRLP